MFEDFRVMGQDSCASHLDPLPESSTSSYTITRSAHLTLTPVKLRLREERKRIIRALDAKYHAIDDHEKAIQRFVLIRNNLRRLRREANEEKQARLVQRNSHSNFTACSRVSNISPSCLSTARATARAPTVYSPPLCDQMVTSSYDFDPPISPPSSGDEDMDIEAKSPEECYEDDEVSGPPQKRMRLLPLDDNKENSLRGFEESSRRYHQHSEAQEILRDLYETCVSEEVHSSKQRCKMSQGNEDERVQDGYPSSPFYTDQPISSGNESSPMVPCEQSDYSISSRPDPNYNGSSFRSSESYTSSCEISSSSDEVGSSGDISSNLDSSSGSNINDSDSSNYRPSSPFPRYNCGKSALLGNDLQSVVFHSLMTSMES